MLHQKDHDVPFFASSIQFPANLCKFLHLFIISADSFISRPLNFPRNAFISLNPCFIRKQNFTLETKGGMFSGSFVIFTRNGASGWRFHFLYCSLSRLTPVIRLCLPDWRCDAVRETSLVLPSNCTKSERMPPFLTTGSKVRGLQWKGLERRESEYFKVHDPIRDDCAVYIINVKVAKQQRVKYLTA